MRAFEKAPPDVQEILTKPIKELGLKLEGSPLERLVQQLYRELERKGLSRFRPLCYLTDEWGCPSGEPVIGIPFYLADPKLARLEKEMNDLEDRREIMMYLRHEAGHAFNYAYELYTTPEWRDLFGPFRRPYRDSYRPVPFSRQLRAPHRRLVRAEAPRRGLRRDVRRVADAALAVAQALQGLGRDGEAAVRRPDGAPAAATRSPLRPQGHTDITVEEMETTVEEFYKQALEEQGAAVELALDTDLVDIFKVSQAQEEGRAPGGRLLRENRKTLIDKVTYWTGVQRPLVKRLVESIGRASGELDLRAAVREREGAPDRGHRLRHRARDELPDARKVRAAVSRRERSA